MGQNLFQSERFANLLIDVIRSNVRLRRFEVIDFVVMPNHLHIVFTVRGNTTVERAAQCIKGGFSFRVERELGYVGEVWQPGFSEERVDSPEALQAILEYIAQNPVRAGLAKRPDEYPFCYRYLVKKKRGRG